MNAVQTHRTSLQLLRDRNFGTLFWGKLVLVAAIWALTLLHVVMTYNATGSATWVGVVGAAQLCPQLLLALVSGRMSDARGPLPQIILGGIVCGVSALGLAAWWKFAGQPEGLAAAASLIIASFAFGCGHALAAPALHSIVPRLVEPPELASAVALNFIPSALARTLGPAGGALVAAASGPVVSLTVIGGLFLAISVCFRGIQAIRDPGVPDRSERGVWSAVRYVIRDRYLLAFLVGVGLVSAGSEPATSLAPVLAASLGHAGEGGGWIASSFGVGGLVGVCLHQVLRRWLTPAVEGCLAVLGLGVASACASLSSSMLTLSVLMAVGGMTMVVSITAFSVAIQQGCEPVMLGRVMGLWVIAMAGARPPAALLQGMVADRWSGSAALVMTGCATAFGAAAIALTLWLVGRRRRQHSRETRDARPTPTTANSAARRSRLFG